MLRSQTHTGLWYIHGWDVRKIVLKSACVCAWFLLQEFSFGGQKFSSFEKSLSFCPFCLLVSYLEAQVLVNLICSCVSNANRSKNVRTHMHTCIIFWTLAHMHWMWKRKKQCGSFIQCTNGEICRKKTLREKCIIMCFSGFHSDIKQRYFFRANVNAKKSLVFIHLRLALVPRTTVSASFRKLSVQLHSFGRQNHWQFCFMCAKKLRQQQKYF